MPSQLSKNSEKRLLAALEKTSSLIGSGEHPNDAIIKVAGEDKIPAGHVRLMVNATNTGRTNAQRLTSNDPFEKAAEFPLADAKTVLDALYPDTVQTKQASYMESVVSSEYGRSPRFMAENKRMEKAARKIDWKLTDKKPDIRTDPDLPVKRACAQVRRLEINVEEARRNLHQVRDEAIKLAAELRAYFTKPGHTAYKEARENCVLLMGKAASAVLDRAAPSKEPGRKTSYTPVRLDEAPYSLVKQAITLAQKFKECQEAYTAAVKTANDESEKLLRPFVPSAKAGCSVLVDLCSLPTKTGGVGSFMGRALGSGFGVLPAGDIAKEIGKRVPFGQLGPDIERGDLQSLMDPSHEMEIRNIQSEALVNDLLANDDVIRGYDPEEVIDAYNEISQLAPYAANKKAIIRDLMRKRLTGGAQALDQFVVGDTLGTQEKLRNLSTVPETSLTALKDVGVLPGVPHNARSVLGR